MNQSTVIYKKIDSTVNHVSIVRELGGSSYVKKEFRKSAIKTAIKMPVRRSEVEFSINRFINTVIKEEHSKIAVPEILHFDRKNHTLHFDFIDGINLVNCSKSDFPPIDAWEDLFQLLSKLEKYSKTKINKLFSGLESISDECKNIIYDYKFDSEELKHQNKECLCLGDVKLSNILWSNDKLYLLDFEFAHVGSKGYDLGQLLAHIEVIHGVCMNGNTPLNRNILHWKNVFINYYKNR